jgi:transposase InsO family protein
MTPKGDHRAKTQSRCGAWRGHSDWRRIGGFTPRERLRRRRVVTEAMAAARRGNAGADLGRIQAERSLVGGFRPRPVRLRPAISDPQHRRRVTRECLAAIPDTSISGLRVARELTTLIERRGKPGMIVSDNGTEFTSNAMLAWAHDYNIVWHFIAPGKPMQNGL